MTLHREVWTREYNKPVTYKQTHKKTHKFNLYLIYVKAVEDAQKLMDYWNEDENSVFHYELVNPDTRKPITAKDLLTKYVMSQQRVIAEYSTNSAKDYFELIQEARRTAIDLGIHEWRDEEHFSQWSMESAQDYADENGRFLFPTWMQTWKK